ncbi:MAG TPA: IPT/TIG domain-containing protein [Mycobacteriales bacterium]|nr:IPT/TIG domain-containing protein [Mycobacteriales bacterium]
MSRGIVVVAALAAGGSLLTAPPAMAAAGHHQPAGYARVAPAPRLPRHTHRVGAPAATTKISGAVALAPRDAAALASAAANVSDPRSPLFHHYLRTGAFARRYGPSSQTIQDVRTALRSAGLTTSVSSNHLLVHFHGDAAAVGDAFHTDLARYQTASGRTGTAPAGAVSLPASVAPDVVGVLGLNTLGQRVAHFEHATHPAKHKAVAHHFAHPAGSPQPCAGARKAANHLGGLTDDQVAHAYGATGLYQAGDIGSGQTIALYEAEPFEMSDLKAFDNCYFGAAKAAQMLQRVHLIHVDGGAGKGPGSGEAILDIEDLSALAPGATIDVYDSPNTLIDGIDIYNDMAQDNHAKVISTSWGLCAATFQEFEPGGMQLENEIFEQMALQGQTVFSAAGDAGSDDCAGHSPTSAPPSLSDDDPTAQPFVVGVGGTTVTDAAHRPSEHVWNDGNNGGAAGGGISSVWGAPSWQGSAFTTADLQTVTNAVTDGGAQLCPQGSPTDPAGCRETPDVSADADEFTGAITTYAKEFGGWTTTGGTSSAAPLWAAMLTDVNASAACAGSSVGFAAPLLYAVAANPAEYAASFNDVTSGNNDQYNLFDGRFYRAAPGYDMASGLGSPELTHANGKPGLAGYLCAHARAAGPPAVTGVSPAVVPVHPGSRSLTISGSGFTGASRLSIGADNVPAGDWDVVTDSQINVTTIPAGTAALSSSDGTGRAIVSVTGSSGASSVPVAAAALLYVDTTATGASLPSVSGTAPYGGPIAGGNTITVYGSDYAASGADAVTGVTIGGVSAPFTVVSPTELSVRVPAYSAAATHCATANVPATDSCQAQVVVANANGSSKTASIRPSFHGDLSTLPDVCEGSTAPCELAPASTEYDYFAPPTITDISPGYVSENGDTVVTITGTGFDFLSTIAVNFGNPHEAASADFNTLFNSPTEIDVVANPHDSTTEAVSVPVTVETLQGLSNAVSARYAGYPKLNAISPNVGPDTGGTRIALSGKGFEGVGSADGGEIIYSSTSGPIETDQLSGYQVLSDAKIAATTPQSTPDVDVVQACTITGCSVPLTRRAFDATNFTFFSTGRPVVTGVSVHRGPAAGGTLVVIRGHNLSNVVAVRFGSRLATAHNQRQLLASGSFYRIVAESPPGPPGKTVDIRVETLASTQGGTPSPVTSADRFTWTRSVPAPPQQVVAHAHHSTVDVQWQRPAIDGGKPVRKYVVWAVAERRKPHTPKPPTVRVTVGRGARSAVLHGLRGGWFYRVRVAAVSSLGRGRPGHPPHGFFITDPAR